jgi:hypothetical protein
MKRGRKSSEKINWRPFLTDDEAKVIDAADADAKVIASAQSKWNEKYGRERPKIVKRASERAKTAARLS